MWPVMMRIGHLLVVAAGLMLVVRRPPSVRAEYSQGEDKISRQNTTWHVHSHPEKNGFVTFNVTVDAVTYQESIFFIKKIFTKYGSDQGLIPKHLENLVHKLGLGRITGSGRVARSYELLHSHTIHNECLTVNELLEAFHLATYVSLTPDQFSYLCPALVYQLDLDACKQLNSSTPAGIQHDHSADNVQVSTDIKEALTHTSAKVWGYSAVAVTIISLVGLLGVAVIPIMQKVFYNHLLQFLVALAVGALSGDALLHLLPHSIMESSEDEHGPNHAKEEHDHVSGAWKGAVALGGILFFFISERLLTIVTVMKQNKNLERQSMKMRCETFCDKESNRKSVSSRLSTRTKGSEDECDKMIMLVHPNKETSSVDSPNALKSFADAAHDEYLHQYDELSPNKSWDHSVDEEYKIGQEPVPGAEITEVLSTSIKQPQSPHVSHGPPISHSPHGGHSHVQTVPNSVAAVAWMVILGDGIHNFSDGLAIGAAFANSITGGFSTSIAVFCHELPHEIGDFAVLLRAGMPAKQAVLYNCLSSVLCFIGMLIGVAMGNIESASLWIFAVVGGMFLYIALVDMLPEMSSVDPKKGENPFLHLLLQVAGILLGSSIMLLIAIFENDIKTAFE